MLIPIQCIHSLEYIPCFHQCQSSSNPTHITLSQIDSYQESIEMIIVVDLIEPLGYHIG